MEEGKASRWLIFSALLLLFVACVFVGIYINKKYNPAKSRSANDEDIVSSLLVKELDPPLAVPDFSLLDHKGKAYTLENLKGKWNFLFFGYTFCPEVCPTTINTLDSVFRLLSREDVGVVFVSFDPERDTVKQLSEYLPYFNEKFTGLTGRAADIKALADSLDISYSRYVPKGSDEASYQFYHDTTILLVNPLGRLVARFSAPHDSAFISKKFTSICEGDEGKSCSINSAPGE